MMWTTSSRSLRRAIREDVKIMDVVFAMGACTSNYAYQYGLPGTYAPIATYELPEKAVSIASQEQSTVGNVLWQTSSIIQ